MVSETIKLANGELFYIYDEAPNSFDEMPNFGLVFHFEEWCDTLPGNKDTSKVLVKLDHNLAGDVPFLFLNVPTRINETS